MRRALSSLDLTQCIGRISNAPSGANPFPKKSPPAVVA
ncbi:hypothetical protein LTSEUGA_5284 [Salmonella enterica subsp. enterica serovar Uganda str. R8-3404]|uniref:Uncharacterized protein n=1 Tax=Salmonella enterica subsp. enterica serovar Uganda str. R8-3404 TaxID=913083 RepID=A0A6C8GX49_SALET|nr:hypothetical protein LTSEUGA_5284 [Salmonella enterica subsp. enterica serovar Uganda str. R8-3404]